MDGALLDGVAGHYPNLTADSGMHILGPLVGALLVGSPVTVCACIMRQTAVGPGA
jgi:hypothetical protein